MDSKVAPTDPRLVSAPSWFRRFEIAAIVVCIGATLVVAAQAAIGMLARPSSTLSLIAAMVLGYLACDLVSGIVHFVCDTFGTVDTPYLGRTFVLPFRHHHVDPGDICVHDFVETNGNNAFAANFLVVPFALSNVAIEGGLSSASGVFVVVFSISVLLTNQFHKWAHVPSPPRLVRALQSAGLLLSPTAHRAHHDQPRIGGYCVTSGLCNRVLDPIDFFPFLERVIRRAFRLGPRPT